MRVIQYAGLLLSALAGATAVAADSVDLSLPLPPVIQAGAQSSPVADAATAGSVSPGRAALLASLRHYMDIRDSGGWPAFERRGPVLKAGDRSDEIPVLRELLWRTGDLAEAGRANTYFDHPLQRALQRFQTRHGLATDGVLGPHTRKALAVGIDDRILQLRINLARWRDLPVDPGEPYIRINTAAFELEAHAAGVPPLSMRVIVGRRDRQTPAFDGQLSYLVFNPYWHVPGKVARRDLIPKQLRDPAFFMRRGIRVLSSWQKGATELDPLTIDWRVYSGSRYLPYKLQQDPGPGNALGRIKFMLPNRYSVYLHDTPAKHLFDQSQRMFSAGCVRVQDPLALARFLVGSEPLDGQSLESIVESGKTRTLRLDRPVPVFLQYRTAWAGADGTVNFRDDHYQRDAVLASQLSPKLLAGNDSFDAGKLSKSLSVAR